MSYNSMNDLKKSIKNILYYRYNIDIEYPNIDYDCTKIYVNNTFELNKCESLLKVLGIDVYSVYYGDDIISITCELIK